MPIWNPSIAIGVPAIDDQHQELFSRTDALLEAMRKGSSADEVRRLLAFLDEYCVHHFGCEERLMRARRYPGLDDHLAQHAHFRKEFDAIRATFERSGPTSLVAIGIQKLVSGWLVAHIASVDRKLAAFLGDARVEL